MEFRNNQGEGSNTINADEYQLNVQPLPQVEEDFEDDDLVESDV